MVGLLKNSSNFHFLPIRIGENVSKQHVALQNAIVKSFAQTTLFRFQTYWQKYIKQQNCAVYFLVQHIKIQWRKLWITVFFAK